MASRPVKVDSPATLYESIPPRHAVNHFDGAAVLDIPEAISVGDHVWA